MNVNKMVYLISLFLMALGAFFLLNPIIPDVLSLFNGRMAGVVFGFTAMYIGVVIYVFMRMREKRQKKLERNNKVFLIYSDENKEEVRMVQAQLVDLGFEVWFDEISLLPGQIKDKEVDYAIRNCSAAILFVSDSGLNDSEKREMNAFLKNKSVSDERFMPILPVLIGNGTVPDILSDVVYVRYDDRDLIRKLTSALSLVLGKK
ncbi:toll/interleukin-1 receptor domain-containing protein [Serratia fonticola]